MGRSGDTEGNSGLIKFHVLKILELVMTQVSHLICSVLLISSAD